MPHVKAARMLKKELLEVFPETKFSVTSKAYSGGDSIYVAWEGEPSCAAVAVVSKKYEYGEYNVLIDLYEVNNQRKDIPQVKYVILRRKRNE